MNRDQLIERIQKHGLNSSQAIDVLRACDEYMEANTKEFSDKGALSLANLVEKMREAQFNNYANKKALQVKVDNAIKRIKELSN